VHSSFVLVLFVAACVFTRYSLFPPRSFVGVEAITQPSAVNVEVASALPQGERQPDVGVIYVGSE